MLPPDLRKLTAQLIVTSRLLVLQSKRLLLQGHMRQRRWDRTASAVPAPDLESRLYRDTASAEDRYRSAVLKYGLVDSPEFWLVAYGTLMTEAEGLLDSMHHADVVLQGAERDEVRKDSVRLQEIVDGWREVLSQTISEEVA